MEKLYRDYGGPFTMVLVASLAVAVFSRLSYGVDLAAESAGFLNLRSTFPSFEAWDVLGLRRMVFFLQLSVALTLGFLLRNDLPRPALCLSLAGLFCLLPQTTYGLTSISLLVPGFCFFQCATWAWWQNPRRSMSLIVPFAGLLVILCHPLLALYIIPLILALFFRRIPVNALHVRLSLLASLNFCALILYVLAQSVGWSLSLDYLYGVRPWPLMSPFAPAVADLDFFEGLRYLFPGSFHSFLFILSLIMAGLLPAKFFHYFYTAIALCYVLSRPEPWSGGAGVQAFMVFSIPVLLAHFWKIRRALLPTENFPFAVLIAVAAFPLLYFIFGFIGFVVGSLFLLSLTFVVGHLRGVRLGATLSSFVVALLLVVTQYQNTPPQQARSESIETLADGVFKGLMTTRAFKNEFTQLRADLEPFAEGLSSLFVDRDRPGYYLLTGLDPVPALPLNPESDPEFTREALGDTENLPDAVLLFEKELIEGSPAHFFRTHAAYRSYRENERYQILVKSEFLDRLAK